MASVVLLGACRADVAVEIDVHGSGAGLVRAVVALDEAAASHVPDLARQLRLEDLEASGWEVEGPTPVDGGGVELKVSKGFTSPGQASQVIDELSGEDGPFSSLRVVRRQSLWRIETAIEGAVDLRDGLDAFGDPRLIEQLEGPNLGLDPAAVERELGRPLAEAVTVTLVADLPGQEEVSWPVTLGSSAVLAVSADQLNVLRVVGAAGALLSGVALVLAARRRRRRR